MCELSDLGPTRPLAGAKGTRPRRLARSPRHRACVAHRGRMPPRRNLAAKFRHIDGELARTLCISDLVGALTAVFAPFRSPSSVARFSIEPAPLSISRVSRTADVRPGEGARRGFEGCNGTASIRGIDYSGILRFLSGNNRILTLRVARALGEIFDTFDTFQSKLSSGWKSLGVKAAQQSFQNARAFRELGMEALDSP